MSFMTRARLQGGDAAQRGLTRLLLAESRRDAGHRLVWTLFGDDPDAARDFVYRETALGQYLIVSARAPAGADAVWRAETKPYAPRFDVGARLAFDLRAVPVRSVRTTPGGRGRRIDATTGRGGRAGAALAWLLARGEALGVRFDGEACRVDAVRPLRIPRPGQAPIAFTTADFRGVLEVADPARLAQAATSGVGRAKAYGCGLLLLRPLVRVVDGSA